MGDEYGTSLYFLNVYIFVGHFVLPVFVNCVFYVFLLVCETPNLLEALCLPFLPWHCPPFTSLAQFLINLLPDLCFLNTLPGSILPGQVSALSLLSIRSSRTKFNYVLTFIILKSLYPTITSFQMFKPIALIVYSDFSSLHSATHSLK